MKSIKLGKRTGYKLLSISWVGDVPPCSLHTRFSEEKQTSSQIEKEGTVYYSTSYNSPIDELTLVGKDDALVGLWMGGKKYYGATLPEKPSENASMPALIAAKRWLNRYFAGEKPTIKELS